MTPIAMGQGPGASARASMAKVILGGQLLSLLLSLLVTPVAYSLWDDLTRRLRRVAGWFGRRFRRPEPTVVEAKETVLEVPVELVPAGANGTNGHPVKPLRDAV
jgi:HAE1 family hydrophobic/amphiphilic exporter-1